MKIVVFVYFIVLYFHTSACADSNIIIHPEIMYYNVTNLNMQILTNNSYVMSIHEDSTISENCTQAAETFTENITNLTRCLARNARPIRLCVNCMTEIKETEESFNNLQKVSPECQAFYFGSDQIGVIALLYSQGENIWDKSSCQNCYDHADETKKFLKISEKLNKCIQYSNQSKLHSQNGTCDLCHDLFVELNEIYNSFVKNISHEEVTGVCMDIVDQMNITRQVWNKLNCVKFDADIGYPNIITAVLVGVMPVFFYLLSKNISIIEDVKLVRPKRKSFASRPTE